MFASQTRRAESQQTKGSMDKARGRRRRRIHARPTASAASSSPACAARACVRVPRLPFITCVRQCASARARSPSQEMSGVARHPYASAKGKLVLIEGDGLYIWRGVRSVYICVCCVCLCLHDVTIECSIVTQLEQIFGERVPLQQKLTGQKQAKERVGNMEQNSSRHTRAHQGSHPTSTSQRIPSLRCVSASAALLLLLCCVLCYVVLRFGDISISVDVELSYEHLDHLLVRILLRFTGEEEETLLDTGKEGGGAGAGAGAWAWAWAWAWRGDGVRVDTDITRAK